MIAIITSLNRCIIPFQATIGFSGIHNLFHYQGLCYYAFHDFCEEPPMIIQDTDIVSVQEIFFRCSVVDTLFRSSLQCLYSQECRGHLLRSIHRDRLKAKY